MRNQRTAALAVAAAALVLSSLPYLVAYLTAPNDRVFMGIVSSVPDWSQYLAWLRAFGERVVIDNVLTCEPASPAFFNIQWLLLGRLANLLPVAVVLQLFRLATTALFLWLTYRTCDEYFRQRGGAPAKWAAWLLINFSAGLGWFWVVEKRLSGALRYPMDVYVYEPVSFQNMLVFPHFLLAAALLLVIFRCAARAIEERKSGYVLLAALGALFLGLAHAYDLIIVYGVLGVFVLCLFRRDGFSWRPLLVVALIGIVSAPPPLYFVYLTTSDPLWRQVLSQFKNAGVFTPSPLHLLMLLGVPLLLTLATWRNVVPRQWPSSWPLLVRVWAIVNLPLLYIPTDYQIHMLSGWQIPLGLLAAEGVFAIIAPRLAARGWLNDEPGPRRFQLTSWGLVLLLFALAVPTNLYLLAWRVLEVLKVQHTHYLYRDETDALAWLDANSDDDDVVMGSVVVTEYVPFLAGNKVQAGHWAQTVRYEDRKSEVKKFFDTRTREPMRRAILARCNVAYLLYGREERALGDFNPAAAPYLELAHEEGKTRIYRVARAALVANEGSPWSAPQWISKDLARSAWFPDIAADAGGGVHVFWHSKVRDSDAVVHCKVGPRGCEEADLPGRRPPAGDGSYVTRPSAGGDASGMLHLIWKSKFTIAHTNLFVPDTIDGWRQPQRLGEGTYTALGVEPNGTLHAVFTRSQFDSAACKGCVDVLYRRSRDGVSWTPPVNLSHTEAGSEKPNIALSKDGSVYIAWEEGTDFYTAKGDPEPSMLVASHDGGLTWEPPIRFWPDDVPQSPAVEVAGDGTIVAVWRSTKRDGVFSQTSTDRGATWSPPVQIEGLLRRHHSADELDGLDMATDSAGIVHLVAAGRTAPESTENAMYHVAWDGKSWGKPEEIFRTKGTAEWPRIAIASGNELHATWFERPEGTVWNSEGGRYRVWYSQAKTTAPRIPPPAWPAPPLRLARPQTLSSLLEAAMALIVVLGVIALARRARL